MENKGMKILKILICFISIILHSAFGATPKQSKSKPQSQAKSCSKGEMDKIRNTYRDLQNALKYDGKDQDIKIVNGKALPNGNAGADSEDSLGKEAEKILFNQYKAALVKVDKIYRHLNNDTNLNSDEIKIKANPIVVQFFKSINLKAENKKALDINIKTLLDELKRVEIKDYKLDDKDEYLLTDLLIHSQDRECTLGNYNKIKLKNNQTKTQYLDQLKQEPLNKMIEALNRKNGNEDLKLANTDVTLNKTITDSINALRKNLLDNAACVKFLANPKFLGEALQSCNYGKFIDALTENNFNNIKAILHFINANQKDTYARTSLDNLAAIFKSDSHINCYKNEHNIYIQNLPFLPNGKDIDTSLFTCQTSTSQNLKGNDCKDAMDFVYENGLGFKISAKPKNAKKITVTNFSIKNVEQCDSLSLKHEDSPVIETPPLKQIPEPVKPPIICNEDNCLSKFKKEEFTYSWKNGVCIESSIGKSPPEINDFCKDDKVVPPVLDKKDPVDPKADCLKEGKIWNEAKSSCDEKPKKDPKEECLKEGKIWNEAKPSCDEKPKEDKPKEEKCVRDEENQQLLSKSAVAECKAALKPESENEEDTKEAPEENYVNKPLPGRFVPVTIPTRQMYVLPGMP
jgi:hypothetical protein